MNKVLDKLYILVSLNYDNTWPLAVSESIDCLKRMAEDIEHPISERLREKMSRRWSFGREGSFETEDTWTVFGCRDGVGYQIEHVLLLEE